ncbi:TetR/AcrR family transcriptional regulator [Chitinivorax sp. PXF-14]|uniref:TetR/AcrR family transcriptional regulator n=1 Tax=Chitinivorax sp. PXF-14 TaxID=3230488 RepID=UPI003467CFFD
MRYDPEHKQRTHRKVVMAAAKAIRQYGPDKIGVATLMSKAGLTHGGFYAHFKSKDALLVEAIDYMFEERMAALHKVIANADPVKGMGDYIDLYLSPLHRDRRDKGCPAVALSGDVARMTPAARQRFEVGIQMMIAEIAGTLRRLAQPEPEVLAASILFEMVGAMAIVRGIADDERSTRMLDEARRSVRQRAGLPG